MNVLKARINPRITPKGRALEPVAVLERMSGSKGRTHGEKTSMSPSIKACNRVKESCIRAAYEIRSVDGRYDADWIKMFRAGVVLWRALGCGRVCSVRVSVSLSGSVIGRIADSDQIVTFYSV